MLKDINERYHIDGYVFGPADDRSEAEKLISHLFRR